MADINKQHKNNTTMNKLQNFKEKLEEIKKSSDVHRPIFPGGTLKLIDVIQAAFDAVEEQDIRLKTLEQKPGNQS